MKEGQKSKKSSKKWLIAIVLVVIIAVIAFVLYQGIFTLPTGLATGTNTEAAGGATTPVSGPTITPTGNEIISKSLVNVSLPYYEAIDLEPGRYSIEVSSDDPIGIRLYSKLHFDEWQKTGDPGMILAGTRAGEEYKVKSLAITFAIYPPPSPTKFYLLFLGNKTTIKFKITQNLKLQ